MWRGSGRVKFCETVCARCGTAGSLGGKERGRLAVGLDRLTNALVLVGQHGVYCTSQRNPTVPAMDLRMITQELVHAKELVQSVMEEIRQAREVKSDSSS